MDNTPSNPKRPRTHSDENITETCPVTEQLNKPDSENKDSSNSTEFSSLTHSDHIVSHSAIPDELSHWVSKNIEDLNIKSMFQPHKSPYDLITRPASCTGLLFSDICISVYDIERIESRKKEKQRKVSELAKFVKRSGFLDMIQHINYASFEMLNFNSLLKMNLYKNHCFLPEGLPSHLEAWFRRFDVHARSFIYLLSRMVENEIQGIPNKKHEFLHLFDSLAKMFGMQSGFSFDPILQPQTLEINNVEVNGKPDIVYAHHRMKKGEKKLEKPHIVAVCKVEKDKPVPMNSCESQSSSYSRNRGKKIEEKGTDEISSSTSKIDQKGESLLQISDELIGQHCGELLFGYGQSIWHSTICGIVVQQTHVTFTELGMTNEQYDKIKKGRLKHGDADRPIFAYTKPYDFLKKEELEMLIEPFIKFGLEQEQ